MAIARQKSSGTRAGSIGSTSGNKTVWTLRKPGIIAPDGRSTRASRAGESASPIACPGRDLPTQS